MKGQNELLLNEATMVEAVQFWLNSRMLAPVPKVCSVKQSSGGTYTQEFRVLLESTEGSE